MDEFTIDDLRDVVKKLEAVQELCLKSDVTDEELQLKQRATALFAWIKML